MLTATLYPGMKCSIIKVYHSSYGILYRPKSFGMAVLFSLINDSVCKIVNGYLRKL